MVTEEGLGGRERPKGEAAPYFGEAGGQGKWGVSLCCDRLRDGLCAETLKTGKAPWPLEAPKG